MPTTIRTGTTDTQEVHVAFSAADGRSVLRRLGEVARALVVEVGQAKTAAWFVTKVETCIEQGTVRVTAVVPSSTTAEDLQAELLTIVREADASANRAIEEPQR